jgi:two-component system response regulator HydG
MKSTNTPAPSKSPEESLRVLIIDDDPDHAEVVAEGLERVGYRCEIATSGSKGAKRIEKEDFDLILTDLRMPDMDGLAILHKAKLELPEAEVVVITGHGDVKTAVKAIREGAANFLEKPVSLGDLRAIMDRAAERLRLTRANKELKRQLDEKFGFEGVVGNSPNMHEIIARLKAIAPTSVTVLIQGETGTGKELVAKAIHNNSPRKNKNFVAMNCTALNENLLEDELFGHESGAFTGADRLRKGRFEHANGGTLFLDEIGDMPPTLQSKLLRVLEDQEVYRIGSNDPIKVNVRLLAATNRDLEAAVEKGEFRQDLYFRLKVARIRLPALRERREDIPLLVAHFIKEFNQRHGKEATGLNEPVRRIISAHKWPGNVRELKNMIESMVVQDYDGILGLDDLQDVESLGQIPDRGLGGPTNLVGQPLHEIERYYIEETLALAGGNREEAARILGIGERTIYRMIQDWKLQDQINEAIAESNNDMAKAAEKLGLSESALQKKLKKWGQRSEEDPA